MKIITLPFNLIAIGFVKGYQKTKRRKYRKCLHHPSCSNYALLALKKYNIYKALKLTISRYKDCNLFSNRPFIDYP